MSDKLFYNVPKEKAGSFKSTVSNAIGFVAQTDTEGYMIANGKEFGKMRVSSSNSFDVNGTQYSIIVNADGALSVSKYIATALSSVSLTALGASKTQEGSGTQYVGTSYTLKVGIDVTSTKQEIKINVSNPTGNKYKLAIYDGTSYIMKDESFRTSTGEISYFAYYVMNDVATETKTGTLTWANASLSKNTEGEKTFTVYLTEEGKTTKSSAKTQSNINASATVTPKVPLMYGTNGTAAGCTTLLQDYTFGGAISLDKNLTFNAGNIPVFAVPTCLGKELKCFNDTGALEDTSLKKYTTTSLTLNGCTTEYDIYIYAGGAWGGSATIKVKFK